MRYGWVKHRRMKERMKKIQTMKLLYQFHHRVSFIHSFVRFLFFFLWNKYLKSRNSFIFRIYHIMCSFSHIFCSFCLRVNKIKFDCIHILQKLWWWWRRWFCLLVKKKFKKKFVGCFKNVSYYLFQYCVLCSLLLTIKFSRADAFSSVCTEHTVYIMYNFFGWYCSNGILYHIFIVFVYMERYLKDSLSSHCKYNKSHCTHFGFGCMSYIRLHCTFFNEKHKEKMYTAPSRWINFVILSMDTISTNLIWNNYIFHIFPLSFHLSMNWIIIFNQALEFLF